MIDEVCYYLKKSYPEVITMQRTLIQWHYLNAMERQQKETERLFELHLAVQDPERYKRYIDKKRNEVQNKSYVETTDSQGQIVSEMDYETFKEMTKLYKNMRKNEVIVETMQDGKIIAPENTMQVENEVNINIDENIADIDFSQHDEFFKPPEDDEIYFDRS